MTDEKEREEKPAEAAEATVTAETTEAVETPVAHPVAPEREFVIPRSKYERIMMAAAEASRLNEETRRKGTKLERKVTLEALKRVDERKVKSVSGGKGLEVEPRRPRTEPTVDTLFLSPPLLADTDLADEGTEEPTTEKE
jgi:hypothetical protein